VVGLVILVPVRLLPVLAFSLRFGIRLHHRRAVIAVVKSKDD
jgi:hypothetical protein